MRVSWDPAKAEANLRQHGIRFSDAVTVLEDDQALTREDPLAEGEQRLVTLGTNSEGRVLVVVYTLREPDEIRLISSWPANRRQRLLYEEDRS